MRSITLIPFFWVCVCLVPGTAGLVSAQETGTLSGRVVDVAQVPVAGAAIFVYDSGNTRRPADYISPPSDSEGEYHLALPSGHYWVVARKRQGEEKYGPLLPGDKHSGAPIEIDISAGETLEEEFVVADLKETSQLVVKRDTNFLRIEGQLLTGKGDPVENAYAFASRDDGIRRVPEYVSAWSDESGRYILFLPPGRYWLGFAKQFPPDQATVPWQKVTIDNPANNINIVIR